MLATAAAFNYAQLTAQFSTGKTGQSAAANVDFSVTMAAVSVETETAQPRTLDDVKREFYSYLDSLAVSPGLAGTSISVTVTDAAFEKMLANPEYEQKMKDLCARDICDPAWTKMAGMGISPSACVVTIDADCGEEYIATSYNSPSARGKADGDSFWSRRTKNNSAARKAQEKRYEEKQRLLESLQERASERKYWAQELVSSSVASSETWNN